MSAIEDTYSELSAAAQNTAEKNRDRRNRNQLIGLAGNIAIDYYKLGMEEKVDDFFKNAEVVKGRNVYSKAQNLNKVYGEHEAKAVSYVGGEEQYVYDTFVMPYAQRIAEQEYEGWAEGYTDESKAEVLKDFANKFKDDIYNQYKNIQELRSKVDLSKNYEDFIGDANVFPDSMGQELIGKIFGNKKNKAEVLLESTENVLKQISPDIYALGGQEIFQQDSFDNAKDYMENFKSGLTEKFERTGTAVDMPLQTVDGKAEVTRKVNVLVSKLDPHKVKFKDFFTNRDIDPGELTNTFLRSKKIKETSYDGKTTETIVYQTLVKDVDGNEYVISSNLNDAGNSNLLNKVTATDNFSKVTRDKTIPHIVDNQDYDVSGTVEDSWFGYSNDPKSVKQVIESQAQAYGQNDQSYMENIGNQMSAEIHKLDTIFTTTGETSNTDGKNIALRIVLNRQERKIIDDNINVDATFFRNKKTGITGIVNGLEALESYADLVYEGSIPITKESLGNIAKILQYSDASEQYRLLRESEKPVKINVLNNLFNKPSVKTLFSRDFLENRLQSVEPEARERLINSFQKAWEEDFGQTNFNPDAPTGLGADISKATNTNNGGKTGGEVIKSPIGGEQEREKVAAANNRINILKKDGLSHLEIVKAAAADDNISKAQAAAITVGALLDSGGRAVGQDIINIAQDSIIADAYRNKQKIWDIAKAKFAPYRAIYESVFIPPNERQERSSLLASSSTQSPIDQGKLEDLYSGLDPRSIKEITDEVNIIAQEEEDKKNTTVIPNSVEGKIEYIGKLLGDNERQIQFMKRVVNQESRMGKAPGTYDFSGSEGRRGSFGVAQVDEVAFNQVQKKLKDRKNRLSKYVEPFKDATGIDLTTVTYEDLEDDILSIAFARMYLRQRTNAPIPQSIEKQGNYWKKYYNTFKGRGTAKEFVANNENLFSPEA
tara:strand:+ start:5750 stop:8578 length:2829 start_codon:yes stop_codon:yes gene_type:complete